MRGARLGFFTATPALGALFLHAAARGEPGPLALAAAAVGWGALATSGVFFPWLGMFASAACHGPRGGARVALTFDDGPHPVTTRRVLERLAGTRHRATFFVLGEKARRHPDVLAEIVRQGHALGVHGYFHDRLHAFRFPARVASEIERAQDAIEAATGLCPRGFRPPLGHTSPNTVCGARRAGVSLVGWSARGYDGLRGRSPASVVEHVARDLDAGSIVLLHDAAEHDDFEPASIAALPALLRELDARALTSVVLDGWLDAAQDSLLPENCTRSARASAAERVSRQRG